MQETVLAVIHGDDGTTLTLSSSVRLRITQIFSLFDESNIEVVSYSCVEKDGRHQLRFTTDGGSIHPLVVEQLIFKLRVLLECFKLELQVISKQDTDTVGKTERPEQKQQEESSCDPEAIITTYSHAIGTPEASTQSKAHNSVPWAEGADGHHEMSSGLSCLHLTSQSQSQADLREGGHDEEFLISSGSQRKEESECQPVFSQSSDAQQQKKEELRVHSQAHHENEHLVISQALSSGLSQLEQSNDAGDSPWWGHISPDDAVGRIMSHPVRWINKDADLGQAKMLMNQFRISALLVDTGSTQPGLITKRGFLQASFTKSFKRTKVKDVMTQPVLSVNVDSSIQESLQIMQNKFIRRLPVFDERKFDANNPGRWQCAWVGMISDTDIFRCLGQPSLNQDIISEGLSAGDPMIQKPVNGKNKFCSSVSSNDSDSSRASILSLRLNSMSSAGSRMHLDARALSTEDRYRAAAALWELDFSELEVIRKIGEGSFGEVVLANFRGTKVAVKRLRGFEADEGEIGTPSTMQPILSQFFEREIEIIATMRHPNVVNFIGACHTHPNICLVTEYCARGSLDQLLHKSGLHLDIVKKVEFSMDIARGCSCLHSQRPPIIHRDLKTANLLVSARFEVKVADFGLSRIKDHAQLVNSRAGLEGTIEYCAPEVLRGEPYTEKCDIWSYGVVLWELFHRQRPYADADVPIYLLMMSLGNGSLKLPPMREDLSSSGLVRLAERCLSWDPIDRPGFREVLHILEHEYKIVRGKAAAVPRSDSASCMLVKTEDVPLAIASNGIGSQQDMQSVFLMETLHEDSAVRQNQLKNVLAHALETSGHRVNGHPLGRNRLLDATNHVPHSRFAPCANNLQQPTQLSLLNSKQCDSFVNRRRSMTRSSSTPVPDFSWMGLDLEKLEEADIERLAAEERRAMGSDENLTLPTVTASPLIPPLFTQYASPYSPFAAAAVEVIVEEPSSISNIVAGMQPSPLGDYPPFEDEEAISDEKSHLENRASNEAAEAFSYRGKCSTVEFNCGNNYTSKALPVGNPLGDQQARHQQLHHHCKTHHISSVEIPVSSLKGSSLQGPQPGSVLVLSPKTYGKLPSFEGSYPSPKQEGIVHTTTWLPI